MRHAGRDYAVRCVRSACPFRYERGLLKEPFALALLNAAPADSCDDVAAEVFAGLLGNPVGGPMEHALSGRLLLYDWSGECLPAPYLVANWIDGAPLWAAPEPEGYRRAGTALAGLHRIRFRHFYKDLFAVGRTPEDGATRFRAAFGAELAEAAPQLPADLCRALAAIDAPAPARACLVHNDVSGANLLVVRGGAITLIDWDNWVIDAPELDLVKMRYWTRPGPDGPVTPDAGLFEAFLAGYRSAGGPEPDPVQFRARAALWLLRVFNFETARAADRGAGRTGDLGYYPPAAAYLPHLAALAES